MVHKLICKILKNQNVIITDEKILSAKVIELLQSEKVPVQRHITPEGTPGFIIRDAEHDFLYLFIPMDVAYTEVKNLVSQNKKISY